MSRMLLLMSLVVSPGCLSPGCEDGEARACPCEGGPAGKRLCDGGIYAPCRCRRAEREEEQRKQRAELKVIGRKQREWKRQRAARIELINAGALLDLEIAKDTTPQRAAKIAERAAIDAKLAEYAARYPVEDAPGEFEGL